MTQTVGMRVILHYTISLKKIIMGNSVIGKSKEFFSNSLEKGILILWSCHPNIEQWKTLTE